MVAQGLSSQPQDQTSLFILTVLVALLISVHASDSQGPDTVVKQLCEVKWGEAHSQWGMVSLFHDIAFGEKEHISLV